MLAESGDDIFSLIYPLVEKFVDGDTLKKLNPPETRKTVSEMWLAGASYAEILNALNGKSARIHAGSQRRKVTVQHIVDICDGELAFDGMLVLGAIAEIVEDDLELFDTTIPDSIRLLQRRIKYGLPDELTVRVYELGFSERVIAQELSEVLKGLPVANRFMLIEQIKINRDELQRILDQYPAYFSEVLERYVD